MVIGYAVIYFFPYSPCETLEEGYWQHRDGVLWLGSTGGSVCDAVLGHVAIRDFGRVQTWNLLILGISFLCIIYLLIEKDCAGK